MAQLVKNLPAMWENWFLSLGWEDPLEKGMAIQSCILAWEIPQAEEPVGYSLWGHKELDMTGCLNNRMRIFRACMGNDKTYFFDHGR